MTLKRLRSSAARSGVGLSSADPALSSSGKWASKLGSTEIGSAIFSKTDGSLNLELVDEITNAFDAPRSSARTMTAATFMIELVCDVEMSFVVLAVLLC